MHKTIGGKNKVVDWRWQGKARPQSKPKWSKFVSYLSYFILLTEIDMVLVFMCEYYRL